MLPIMSKHFINSSSRNDSITCNINSDELNRNCNNRKIKVKISNSDGYIRSISFKSDSSWIKCIQLAKDVHSNNVIIELINNNQIRLRTIREINENEELFLWFTEDISIKMNIPFLTPINIRGNNCYICHNCKASFEYPNPLKIHLATSCSNESPDILWKNLINSIKKNVSSDLLSESINNIKPQMLLPSSQESINASIATTLLFTSHNHVLMKSQPTLYQYDHQSAFKRVTPPPLSQPPPPPPTSQVPLSLASQLQQKPQQLPQVSAVNHIPSHTPLLLHHQYSTCNYQHLPLVRKSSPLHRTLFNSSSSSSSPPSSTSLSIYSSSTSVPNTLVTTSLSPSLSNSTLSSSLHSHLQHNNHHHHQITPTSASAVAAAAALNAAAQIETIVSNMGASKQGHLCIYCGKLYSRKYGLKIHIRTHTGFKPLKCKYCFRPFGDPSNLNKHVRLHMQSGNLSFRCHLCNKTLARRRDLQRHIETRHCTTGTVDDDTSIQFTTIS
ncbi:PR domain zinc finger protein 13 [Condylostylus longicornis]|uniref:PR domain zinc finger protein 13 n=1 Tax=Condylostylus longicornis TaxID=2530218 RepID=UPI00244DCD4C|nr:PR domain zinc finger protein 13 [Condylostylus longicornis]